MTRKPVPRTTRTCSASRCCGSSGSTRARCPRASTTCSTTRCSPADATRSSSSSSPRASTRRSSALPPSLRRWHPPRGLHGGERERRLRVAAIRGLQDDGRVGDARHAQRARAVLHRRVAPASSLSVSSAPPASIASFRPTRARQASSRAATWPGSPEHVPVPVQCPRARPARRQHCSLSERANPPRRLPRRERRAAPSGSARSARCTRSVTTRRRQVPAGGARLPLPAPPRGRRRAHRASAAGTVAHTVTLWQGEQTDWLGLSAIGAPLQTWPPPLPPPRLRSPRAAARARRRAELDAPRMRVAGHLPRAASQPERCPPQQPRGRPRAARAVCADARHGRRSGRKLDSGALLTSGLLVDPLAIDVMARPSGCAHSWRTSRSWRGGRRTERSVGRVARGRSCARSARAARWHGCRSARACRTTAACALAGARPRLRRRHRTRSVGSSSLSSHESAASAGGEHSDEARIAELTAVLSAELDPQGPHRGR